MNVSGNETVTENAKGAEIVVANVVITSVIVNTRSVVNAPNANGPIRGIVRVDLTIVTNVINTKAIVLIVLKCH